jgi:hypothetical protein
MRQIGLKSEPCFLSDPHINVSGNRINVEAGVESEGNPAEYDLKNFAEPSGYKGSFDIVSG